MLRRLLSWGLAVVMLVGLLGCSLPQVSAEERLFLNVGLDFLGAYDLPRTEFEGTTVGGLSAIAYDRQRDRLYALSDDRSNLAPARFYTLQLQIGTDDQGAIALQSVDLESVTFLQQESGELYPPGSIDPEGLALSPRNSVFISSEGDTDGGIAPFVDEFDLQTGQWKTRLPIPERFVPQEVEGTLQGIRNNRGFESLTLNPGTMSANPLEPFRLFTATEAALLQDESDDPDSPNPLLSRFLHYLIGDTLPTLLAEHMYVLEPLGDTDLENGLTELLAVDQAGHFLTLERSFGLTGFSARIFQMVIGGATDTSGVRTYRNGIGGIEPLRKRLVLDLAELEIPLDNLEGMTPGPRLPDGSQSLLLVSDDNFNDTQKTQFLLFRLNGIS